jgi:hypothetical protein
MGGRARGTELPYFFYGTLLDRELLCLVAGQAIDPRAIRQAVLAGYWRTGVIGRGYPILMRRLGSKVEGILVFGLGRRARTRLAAYEGPNYRLTPFAVTSGGAPVQALVFMFAGFGAGLRSDLRAWSLDRWRQRWKRRAHRRAGRLRTLPGEG